MSSSGAVGPAAAGGGGGGEENGGSCCLLCYSPKVNTNNNNNNNNNNNVNSPLERLEPLDPTHGAKVNANAWAVFVLRKVFRFTAEEVENLLVRRGGEVEPAHWFKICRECVEWVGAFRAADKEAREGAPGAEERVKEMRRMLKEKLRAGLASGDSRSQDVEDISGFLDREVEEEEEEEEVVQPEDRDGGDSEAGHSSVSTGSIPNHASGIIEEASSSSSSSSAGNGTSDSNNRSSSLELGTRSNTDGPLQVVPKSIAEEMEDVSSSAEIATTGTAERRRNRYTTKVPCKFGKKAKAGMVARETTSSAKEADEGSTEGHFSDREMEEEEEVVQPDDEVSDGNGDDARHSSVSPSIGSISTTILSHSSSIIEEESSSSSSAGNGTSDKNNRSVLELGTRTTEEDHLQVVPNSITEKMQDVSSADIAETGTAARRRNRSTTNPCKSGNDAGMMACETTCAKKQESSTKEGPVKKKKKINITILVGDPPMYQCNVCRKKFKTKAHIKYHKFCMVGGGGGGNKPFKCEQCGKGFIAKSHYEYHLRTHTGERPYVCPICGKGFIQRDKMTRHIRSHTGEKPFVCLKCNRGFATAQNLQSHTLIHTGERPFACTYCGKRFTAMATLKNHLTNHTGERRFSCNHCGKRFGLKWTLDLHLRTHSGERPYACDQCTRTFSNKKDFRRHLVIHSGQHPFKCSLCGTAFRRKDNLDRHIKNTHEQPKEVAKQLANEAATQYLKNTAKNTRERESLANIPVSRVNAVVISSIVDQKPDLRRASVRNKKVPAGKSGQSRAVSSSITPSSTSATKPMRRSPRNLTRRQQRAP